MLIYLTMIEAEEDRHRFLSLYRRYKKLMLYIAHDILHDPHDAEDAVHEAFLRLAEMIEKIHEIDCPETRSLIVMITKSKAIDLYRKKKRRAGTVPLEDWAAAASDVSIYDMPYKENNCHAAIFCGDIVAQHLANMNVTCDWADTLDFIVTMDPYFTEGAKWSDYILPCTSRFEYDEPFGNVKAGYSQIVIQEKVIDPLFEAHTDLWIQRELASRLGLEAGIPASSVDRCNAILSTSTEPWVSELTVEKISENGAVWPVPDREVIREVVPDQVFPTPTGRMELYYDTMVPFDQQLPQWEPCTEIADATLRAQFPLQLTNTRTRFRIHNQFYDSDWLQLMYQPLVMLNPADMESRGLETGDVARVFNDRGEHRGVALVNDLIKPGVVGLQNGWWEQQGGSSSHVTNDKWRTLGGTHCCNQTLVDVKKEA